ncbi:MAG: tRNA uridine-5-carboxymethylaminomethyl(34) synthesis GTPase MnmE [Gammaproteobacteria bacterium]|nr:tRNA uridine-5-carboxymethylaminomethyl(34) synthesis GTPase MnmE [Gammaproteobacteria bacterium]
MDTDTIAAVATPPGQGGIGIVRISGPRALAIGETLTGGGLQPRRASYREFVDSDAVIDRGIVLYFPKPNSFTGEDVVELQGHGGPVVLQMLLGATVGQGARLARPGEFTERAFVNDKLDLVQAEAVADLIASASVAAARGALRSLAGDFSKQVHEVDQAILKLRVYVEAAIDFPDEEVEFLEHGEVHRKLGGLLDGLAKLQRDGRQGVLLSQGITVALVGAPNVGKSSLFNRLTGEDTAIVTDIPGTTRDLLKVDLILDGLPVRLVDTAGLRKTTNPVELEGVRRAAGEASRADLVLEIRDLSVPAADPHDALRLPLATKRILVLNKTDLVSGAGSRSAADEVYISCLTGAGFDELKAAIKQQVGFAGEAATFSARRRHLVALQSTRVALERASAELAAKSPGEIIAEELKLAHLELGSITGEVTPDQLLGEIFSTFCIGK